MALFFDTEWFAARLNEKNADKQAFAKALQVTPHAMEQIWNDQRQLSAAEVALAADFLSQPQEAVINYAGIASVQKPAQAGGGGQTEILQRLDSIERRLAELQNLLLAKM